MSQKIEFHKVRGIAEIINTTFEFAKQNGKNLFRAILFISGPFILAGSLLYGYTMYSLINRTAEITSEANLPVSNPLASLGIDFIVLFSVLLIAFFLFYSVVYEYINIYVNQELATIEISDVWKAIRKDFWLLVRTVLGLILLFILIFIVFAIAVIAIAAIGAAFSAITSPWAVFIFIIPAYAFLFYLLVPYSLIFNIRINEQRRFFNSVSQCHALIAGNRLRTLGVILLSLLLQAMLGFVINIPNYIMRFFNMHTSYHMDFGWLIFVTAGLILIASFVVATISIISINLQYFNLVERKQSVSLLTKIEGIGSTPKTTTLPGNEETY